MFARPLWLAATATTDIGLRSYPEIRKVLGGYFVVGLVAFCGLCVMTQRVSIEPDASVMAAEVKEG